MCDGIRSKMREKEDESGKCTSGSSSAALVGGGEKHGPPRGAFCSLVCQNRVAVG